MFIFEQNFSEGISLYKRYIKELQIQTEHISEKNSLYSTHQ